MVQMNMNRPTICGLLSHVSRSCLKRAGNAKLRVALLLLAMNFPFGYGGLALFTLIAGKTGDARWLLGGGVCYALSWAMLLGGGILAGSKAKDFSKAAKGGWRAWKRLRAFALCMLVGICVCGCCGVKPPKRLLAYMYPSLMPMSALKSYTKRPTEAHQARLLLKNAGMEELLAAYGFLDSDYSVLARGLSARGYCEIDGRNCRKCPLKWLYISFGEESAQIVMRIDSGWKGIIAAKEGTMESGPRGELILTLPFPDKIDK